VLPQVNFSTTSGLLQALKNPAVNVRSHAAHLLVKKGKEVFDHVHEFLEEVKWVSLFSKPVPYGCLLKLESKENSGQRFLDNEKNEKLQVVAYRALRHADPKGTLARAKEYADSKNLFCEERLPSVFVVLLLKIAVPFLKA